MAACAGAVVAYSVQVRVADRADQVHASTPKCLGLTAVGRFSGIELIVRLAIWSE